MSRSFPLVWLALFLLLLLPTAAGRFLLDLAGGLMLALFALPLLLSGLGWIGWKVLQSRMITCDVCGTKTFRGASQCLVCGSGFSGDKFASAAEVVDDASDRASRATIDVQAEDVE